VKTDKKEAEKMKELLKEAEGHPLMKQILAEKAAAILATRTEAAEKIKDLEKERDKIIPTLQADLAEKEGKFKKAKETLDIETDEFRKAKAVLSSKSYTFGNSINQQQEVLYETAPEEIDEAVTFFTDKLSFLRSPGRISRTSIGSEKNLFAWKKTVRGETNRDAVLSALTYCQLCIKELELMKLEPELDTEKIERMKAGVPSIDVYTEYQGEKPLERTPHPLAGLPSDSELDWKRDNLMEKAKRLLKR